jgi:Tol biopolymer transport system component
VLKRIVFSRCSPNDGLCAIWIMNADGTHRHLLVPFLTAPTETNNFDPAVSPDGRHISFDRFGYHGIVSQVWVADINGTNAHPVTAPGLEANTPAWSPDGSHIAFASNCCRAQSSVYVMRADGTGLRRLATSMWPNNNFAMRANGTRQHLIATGQKGVLDVAWGTAPPVPAGSPARSRLLRLARRCLALPTLCAAAAYWPGRPARGAADPARHDAGATRT